MTRLALLLAIFLVLPLTAQYAAASSYEGASVPLLAGYWAEFIDHWSTVFQRQNGIVVGAVLIGALCLFIITRGKWKK
jgi:hypothetical protein